jgi:AcrR family transcriptional regulator
MYDNGLVRCNRDNISEVVIMAKLSTEDYINVTYNIIVDEGIEAVSIRYLAQKLGCSSASLYRHFDSVEQLIAYTSLRFLRPYIAEIIPLFNSESYNLESYYCCWNIFLKYSFESPQVFHYAFFNKYRDMLAHAIDRYYQEISNDVATIEPSLRPMLNIDSIFFRDRLMLEHCVDRMKVSQAEIEMTSNILIYIYRGMMSILLEDEVNFVKEVARKQFDESMRLLCRKFIE